jgi:2-oxo-3-hexenedioate decarboxylase/2-keto-4-pentenoate hydratase
VEIDLGRVERAAAALCEAEARHRALPGLAVDAAPTSAAEAYAIQDRFVARLGRPIGYKIAYINPEVQRRLGIPSPMFGRLIEGRIAQSPARLDPARFFNLLVETEFSFRMARGLPASEGPFTLEQVVAAVGAAIPSIELADTRFANWQKVAPLDAVADNALGSRWVGGAPVADFRAFDLAALEAVARVNGVEASRGRGANIIGSPLAALHWLANQLGAMGRGLAAGEIVTTGCCMDVLELAPGDAAEADFGPLGRVHVAFPVSDIMRA